MTPDLSPRFREALLSATGATGFRVREVIQELWSGYGQILRIDLDGGERATLIAKHIRMPIGGQHPRGWNTDVSHQRKVKSYEVETAWYRDWSDRCGERCRIPKFIALDRAGDDVLLLLEDLDAAGFPSRKQSLSWSQIEACLAWLANFHATFLGEWPIGLWETGTYWHLETRPDELAVLDDEPLKAAAARIDDRLAAARFQTLVHGDAKLANFCFSESGDRVAAVDFQYVGGGCGMKDVAYFIGSCLDEASCESKEEALLEAYFGSLRKAVSPSIDANALETEWRALFPFAWTDFHRFLKGWSPGHWKLTGYSERMAARVLAELD